MSSLMVLVHFFPEFCHHVFPQNFSFLYDQCWIEIIESICLCVCANFGKCDFRLFEWLPIIGSWLETKPPTLKLVAVLLGSKKANCAVLIGASFCFQQFKLRCCKWPFALALTQMFTITCEWMCALHLAIKKMYIYAS